MVSYSYLHEADLSRLSTAAAEWRKLPAKYEGLLDQFEQQVVGRLKGHWEGEAAEKGFAHMGKAKGQYEAAATEARRIAKLLEDTHDEFEKQQKQLERFLDDATNDNFKVDDQGAVTDNHPRWESPTAGKDIEWKEARQKLLDGYVRRLEGILERATAADAAADMALRKDANGIDDHGFNRKGHASGDEAEAEKASALAKKAASGEELSKTELNQLNHLLKVNQQDQQFSTKFATDLGPKGTMQFWTQVASPEMAPGERIPKDRVKLLRQMQENLGTTLGTATQTDNHGMKEWKSEIIDLGPKVLETSNSGSAPYGFQVTSNLMRHGEWDNGFLNSYGEKLVAFEEEAARNNMDPKMIWDHPAGVRPSLNLGDPDDRGTDPMTGFMEALGHSSPETDKDGEVIKQSAATSFFSQQDNYDYVMDKREWPEDGKFNSDSISGYNELGHALEAATTGHPYDEAPPKDLPAHSQEQVDLMQRVVHDVSKDDAMARDGMHDSLGRMAAEYMPDINQAMATDKSAAETLFPVSGAKAELTEQDTARFLMTVGEDPDGYAAVNLGQSAYTSNLMDYHLQHPEASPRTTEQVMENIARSNGEVQGSIAVGRQEASIGDEVEADKEYNDAMQRGSSWAAGIIGTGIGVGTSFVASPAVGAGVGGVATTITGDIINSIVSGNERDSMGDAVYSHGTDTEHAKRSMYEVSRESFASAAGANNLHLSPQQLANYEGAIERGTDAGYGQARDNLDDYAREKRAERQG